MSQFRVLTACEQVAGHLREELTRGTWSGLMPGEDRLMARLGVGRSTIKAALRQLEEDVWAAIWKPHEPCGLKSAKFKTPDKK